MTDFRTPSPEPARQQVGEPGPQPDPMLQPGRRSTGSLWLFAILILAIVAGTLYGINNQEPQTAANEPATETTGSNAAPAPAASGGRGTADAPKEQQAQGQTGQGTGAEQNPAAGTQGTPNATTGQGDKKQ